MSCTYQETAPETRLREGIESAAGAVLESCTTLLDLDIEIRGKPAGDLRSGLRGSAIELQNETGGWTLALLCNELTAMVLTRLLFAMEVDDLPGDEDMDDALGELVNVAGGLFKTSLGENGESYDLGLPAPLRGADLQRATGGGSFLVQTLATSDELTMEVVLTHRETPVP